MQIQINTDDHIHGGDALTASVSAAIHSALGRFAERITRVEVHLSDENGSKGGLQDKRCMIEARTEGRKPVAVVEQAATMKQALQGAIDKLVHLLDGTFSRLDDHRRNLPDSPGPDSDPTRG